MSGEQKKLKSAYFAMKVMGIHKLCGGVSAF